MISVWHLFVALNVVAMFAIWIKISFSKRTKILDGKMTDFLIGIITSEKQQKRDIRTKIADTQNW